MKKQMERQIRLYDMVQTRQLQGDFVLVQLIELADAHKSQDDYISGTYWNGSKGCAIGCTVQDAVKLDILPPETVSYDHAALAKALGVPELACHLADHIFERLPAELRSSWTPRFLRSIRPDADYSQWSAKIMVHLCDRLAETVIREDVREACKANAALWRRWIAGDNPTEQQALAAYQQASSAKQQASAAEQQASAAKQQARAVYQQASAAEQHALAAERQYWVWLADVVCQELAAI